MLLQLYYSIAEPGVDAAAPLFKILFQFWLKDLNILNLSPPVSLLSQLCSHSKKQVPVLVICQPLLYHSCKGSCWELRTRWHLNDYFFSPFCRSPWRFPQQIHHVSRHKTSWLPSRNCVSPTAPSCPGTADFPPPLFCTKLLLTLICHCLTKLNNKKDYCFAATTNCFKFICICIFVQ